MSRRKQPAPVRLPDLEGEETTGMGKKPSDAATMTKRSCVKGRQSKERKLNGYSPTSAKTRQQSATNKQRQQHQKILAAQGHENGSPCDLSIRSQKSSDSTAADDDGDNDDDDEKLREAGDQDVGEETVELTNDAPMPECTTRDADDDDDDSQAAGPVFESDSPLGGGGGTTAGVDQVAVLQPHGTGAGGNDEVKCHDVDAAGCVWSLDQAPLDCTTGASAAAAVDGDEDDESGFSGRGSEEIGMDESLMGTDRYVNQEGERASDGEEDRSGGSSPTGSSQNTPSKSSMKRRRPFESPESLTCQLCNIDFSTAHELTLHVRSHNIASSHSCNICGKKLSSTSSLDRHMLIHSGERPFNCPLCSMSFTTNGNMHRHLRTHEKCGEVPPADYVVKHEYAKPRKRIPSRRLLEMDVDYSPQQENPSPKKKVAHEKKVGNADKKVASEKKTVVEKKIVIEKKEVVEGQTDVQPAEDPLNLVMNKEENKDGTDEKNKEEELLCPICNKTFLCRYGLQTHIDQHTMKVLTCSICHVSFRNQKGLRMHVHMAHKKNNKQNLSKRANSPIVEKNAYSMHDLSFADFSTAKFPLIAQVWCEKNSPQSSKSEGLFACKNCDKSFPCLSALDLHHEKTHSSVDKDVEDDASSNGVVSLVKKQENLALRDEFLAALCLKPCSPAINDEEENDDGSNMNTPILNSMLNKPSTLTPEKGKSSLLQQQLQASPLLAMKNLTNPLTRGPLPMKHSPVKGVTVGSSFPRVKVESDMAEGSDAGMAENLELEPRSGDVAMEMHIPTEFASQNNPGKMEVEEQSTEMTVDENDAVVATASDEADDEPCDLTSSNKKKGHHTCKYCKKVFPFASTLKVHTRSHMGLMPYKCMLCDYASADKSTLVRHMRTHSGERPFSCKVCDFAFTTKANCERHVRKRHEKKTKEEAEEVIVHNPVSKHENESKFSSPCTLCKICNRDFKFFRDLQNHLRVHEKTPQKPFTCIKCQVGFSSLSNCARHILRRHEDVKTDEVETYITVYQHDEDKPGSGDNKPVTEKDDTTTVVPLLNDNGEQIEPLDFSIKRERDDAETSGEGRQRRTSIYVQDAPIDLSMPKSHVTPEKYTANSLGRYRFKQVYHKFYSEGIDALVCPHCAAVYHRGSQLKAHIRSHTNERPFRCYSCSAAFTQEANLEAHIIRRHNDSSKSQSFIPNIATPMQFKLMAKSPSNLRFTARTPKITVPTVSPNTPVGTGLSKAGPSPHSSVGSDSSAELASVSKMLAATDSNHFKLFLSPQENRSPITVTEIFRPNDDDQDEESQEIMANISGEVPEMRMDNEEEEEGSKVMDDTSVSQVDDLADSSSGIFQPVTTEDVEMDQYMDEDEHIGGELQIVEEQRGGDVLSEGATMESKKDGAEKKEKRSTKFESKQCCPYCGRRFPWVSSLRRHILTHTGLKPYQCPQCGANFSTKSNCERHIVRRHGGARPGSLGGTVPGGQDQPFMCPECKEFKCTTRTQLQTHYEESHSHINFSEIYPEAKKVASTSVDIHNKQANIKASTNEHPPADDEALADDYDKDLEVAENVATDLSMSKPKKKSKSKKRSLKVKLFINKGKVTAAHADNTEIAIAEDLNEKEEVMEEEEEVEEGVDLRINDVDAAQEYVEGEVNEHQVDNEAEEIENENDENAVEDVENSGVQENLLEDLEENLPKDLQETSSDLQENERSATTASPLPTQVKIPKVTPSSTSKITPTKGKKNRARFECTQCCKRFKTALTLQRHEKVHEVDHPFHCPDCKAKFTTKFNCQRHMMKLHSRTKEDVCTMVEVKEKEVVDSVKSELVNGIDMRTGSDEMNIADQDLENLSGASVNLGDSVSGLADSLKGSRNGIPNSFKSSQLGRKRPSGILGSKKSKSPKLDDALMSGTVLDLQGSSDKLTAVENWLNSDLELQNGDMNGLMHGPEEDLGDFNSSIPVLNPESPTASQEEGSQPNSVWSAVSSAKKPVQQQQGLYMASFLEDEDSLVAQDVANPSDVFSRGQGEEKNADIISNLLGIQDSSVLDQMLESPDSAARLLGVK